MGKHPASSYSFVVGNNHCAFDVLLFVAIPTDTAGGRLPQSSQSEHDNTSHHVVIGNSVLGFPNIYIYIYIVNFPPPGVEGLKRR